MGLELARKLLVADAISRPGLAKALRAHAKGSALLLALVEEGAVDPAHVSTVLRGWEGPSLARPALAEELARALPPGLLERLLAVPFRRDPRTGTVDVAFADPLDRHAIAELSHALAAPVRPVHAPLSSVLMALSGREPSKRPAALAAPIWQRPAAAAEEEEPAPESQVDAIPLTVRHFESIVSSEEDPPPSRRARMTSDAPIPLVGARSSPGAPPRPPFPDPHHVLDAMSKSKKRDDVMRALLEGVRLVARRVGLIVVKRDVFVGWACTGELCGESDWQKMQISTSYPSVLATAAAEGTYLGAVVPSEAHAPLLRALGRASRDVAVTPVKVSGRPALLVLADELGDTALSTKRMEDLSRAAGAALTRIVRERKGIDEA